MSAFQPTSSKTFFDWIEPSLAADGLLVPAPWQREHAILAAAEFTDHHLQQTAVILAAPHPSVLDYIAQAPVLVLAVAGKTRGNLNLRSARLEMATRFIATAGAAHRLPHILRAFGLVPPMRRFAGAALAHSHHRLLAPLAGLAETALAQIIPATAAEQREWFRCLDRFASHRLVRPADRSRLIAWAAVNLRTPEQWQVADDLADWAVFDANRFDPAMTYAQARAACRRWHREQATSRASHYPVSERAKVVNYAPLPTEILIDGLAFCALRSVIDLELESARMHHCVRSYWPFVTSGRSRIYTIRRDDRPLATLELQPTERGGDPLALAQLKGPCNARPADDVTHAAHRFLALANARVTEAAKFKAEAARLARAADSTTPRTQL